MQLFKSGSDWQKQKKNKRVNLIYSTGQSSQILSKAINKKEFNTLFVINFARNIQNSHLQEINNSQLDSYIFDPKSVTQLLEAFKEIKSFIPQNPQSKINIVINDWDTILYLLKKDSPEQLESLKYALIEFNLLSDSCQLYIISRTETQNCNILKDWTESVENLNNNTENNSVQAKQEETITVQAEDNKVIETEPTTVHQSVNNSLSPQQTQPNNNFSEQYNNLIEKLAQSQTKQDLLDIRQSIQADGVTLSDAEKLKLNDMYKVHLQRIKLAEESTTGMNM